MNFKLMAIIPAATFIVLTSNMDQAIAKTLKGTVSYKTVPGKKCDKTTKPIIIKLNGAFAEIQIGKKSDGKIRIDPKTGDFKEKMTNDGDVMSGSVYSGKVLKKRCTGTFTTS